MSDTCRNPMCSESNRRGEEGVSTYGKRFCSMRCELKYDHAKADAQDAQRDAQRDSHHDEPHPEEI